MATNELRKTVLNYPKLKQYLESNENQIKEANEIVSEIAGDFSGKTVHTLIRLIDSTFAKLYDGVSFEVPEDFDLNQLAKDNHIVLVPNHQSHADYVALTYVIYGVYNVPIYVAGGINLNVFPIGGLFRKAGAFFLRRTFGKDQLYKLTFEAYIYYLLKNNQLIEFFFEGGRSRTGKLLSPRFGLFQMLLEAHSQLEDAKPLMFIPVTLAHEQVPESKSHVRELWGAQKKKESTGGLLKVFKIFNKKLGTIHVRMSKGVKVGEYADKKEEVQRLAFECFRSIGKAMPITPTSLISLIMLDEPSGTMTGSMIESRAQEIMDYCRAIKIPFSSSLDEEKLVKSIQHSLEILIDNGKVNVIEKESLNETFYNIKPVARAELLYFKNMILHHFIYPAIMNAATFNVINGQFNCVADLNKYLMEQRKELKYEFYLPTVREFLVHSLEVVSYAVGEKVKTIEACLHFDEDKQKKLSNTLKLFSTSFVYIYEAYFLGANALHFLKNESFDKKRFFAVARDLFEIEREHGRIIHYYESYSTHMLTNTLQFFINQSSIELNKEDQTYKVINDENILSFKEKFAKNINDHVSMSLNHT